MIFKKYISIFIILLICNVNAKPSKHNVSFTIQNQINELYARQYNVDVNDVRINILHFPDLSDISNSQIIIDNSFQQLKLGHHTIKIKLMKNQHEIGSYPITLVTSIIINTPVSKSTIKHGKRVKSKLYEMKKVEIKNNDDDYYRIIDIPDNLITKRLIHENEVIRKSYLRTKPDINRGKKIKIHLVSGDILIKMDGIANKEGAIGDKIKVFCKTTRKHFYGIIKTPQLVVINIEN